MGKFGFLSVLDQALTKDFSYDYEINWDKKHHLIEVGFLLEVKNHQGIKLLDWDENDTDSDILFEEKVAFYDGNQPLINPDEYLASFSFQRKTGLSKEFICYFVSFLQTVADKGREQLIDFLADETKESFALSWDSIQFDKGRKELVEKEFFAYPRY